MDMLALRTNLHLSLGNDIPFSVYTVGTEQQSPITRLKGFSANQLLLTFSGTGLFRPLGQDNWDTVETNSLLYIPAHLPHEYVPQRPEPWSVGFVTFVENGSGLLESWGFGRSPYRQPLRDMSRLMELLAAVWSNSGPHDDAWRSAELLFAFCLELKKQTASFDPLQHEGTAKTARYRDTAADSAVRFLHDYLQRDLTMAELASRVGYSAKQLNRLFRREFGTTPMQYLQSIRLKTAALLLADHPGMTVREVAAYIGMEPVYFSRLFRRVYGKTPSEHRRRRR